jgi:hypothetical protein
MPRRLEDKIRSLVAQLVEAEDDETQLQKLQELRAALHEYMAKLRGSLSRYPFVKEQRALNGIPLPEGARKKVSPIPSTKVSEPRPQPIEDNQQYCKAKGDVPA